MANIARRSLPFSLANSLPKSTLLPTLDLPAAAMVLPTGLARGAITEIVGRRSSGRTAITLHVLAQATARGEICAVVDTDDQFHPASAAAAGVVLSRVLWVRCGGNAEHAMRAADLLLHAGGFGVVALDLCELKVQALNRIPLSYWYRFRGAIEPTPTILLVCTPSRLAKASSCHIELSPERPCWDGVTPFRLLRGLALTACARKPFEGPRHALQITA